MQDFENKSLVAANEHGGQAQYVAPVVRVMTEAEVLSAFQVNATSASMGWWAC